MKSCAQESGRACRPLRRGAAEGTTLLELLACMAILSIILLMLGTVLDVSLGQFRRGVDRTGNRGSARIALRWLEQDLLAAAPSRPANLPRLPQSVNSVQREWFEDRIFFPFEVNRRSGTGMKEPASFQNAAPGFGTLAFVSRLASDRGEDPARSNHVAGAALPVESIVGYYVAYTRRSPLAGVDGGSMKLFRHFRPGGPLFGDGYARGFLLHCSREINDGHGGTLAVPALGTPNPAAVRRGEFDNSSLPFLLAQRLPEAPPATPLAGTSPWPLFSLPARLPSPPPSRNPDRGTPASWNDPTHPIHDTVFPDEALCDHVVRFEAVPYRKVEIDGLTKTLDASALNLHLGLAGGAEWPCLVAPDFIDVHIAVVDASTARLMTRYEDWIVDWDAANPSSWSQTRRRIERRRQDFRQRIHLGTPSRP